MIITSPYGQLRMLTPLFKSSGVHDVQHYQVADTISSTVLFKRMRKEKSIEFIEPDAHHNKMVAIYKNLKTRIHKTVPNYSSKTPDEIFHLYRRVKQDRNHFFGRLGFVIKEDYKVNLKFPPDISILPSAIRTYLDTPSDIFMPMNIWDGILSANE